MDNDIRKLIDDNEAEQKPKTIWDFNTNDRNSYLDMKMIYITKHWLGGINAPKIQLQKVQLRELRLFG